MNLAVSGKGGVEAGWAYQSIPFRGQCAAPDGV
jgi:hypothetical protein